MEKTNEEKLKELIDESGKALLDYGRACYKLDDLEDEKRTIATRLRNLNQEALRINKAIQKEQAKDGAHIKLSEGAENVPTG